jgi:hypothetical protein
MKQLFLFIIGLTLLLSHHVLVAQNNDGNSRKSKFKDQFSINIGIGSSVNYSDFHYSLPLKFRKNYPYFFNFEAEKFSASKSPAISLNYFLIFNQFISVQLSCSYSNIKVNWSEKYIVAYTTYTSYKNEYDLFLFHVGPRFNWYSNKKIRLYSAVSFGIGRQYSDIFSTVVTTYNGQKDTNISFGNMKTNFLDFQIYPIGVIFNDRYNIELGYGGTGFIKLGFVF